jgi:nucleoside-triphosphatase THEP1
VVIGGIPGIGKSSLVKQAIHYLNVRRSYLGGVICIQAKGVTMIENLVKLIARSFMSHLTNEPV